jgi:hypothetical protein
MVTFYNGTMAIGTANVNAGVATLNTTFSTTGKVTLDAVFATNALWETSTSNQVSLFVTGNTPDTVVLQVAPSSLIIGYSATMTATVTPADAIGAVSFYDGTYLVDVAMVGGGMATSVDAFMIPGARSLTAVFSGDSTYVSSTSAPVIVNVSNPGPNPTTTTLTLSEYSGYLGDTVTLTVNVNPPTATGQVNFLDNGNLLRSVVLSSGTVAWSQAFTQGSNGIAAVYVGDATYSSSVSNVQELVLYDYRPTRPSVLL